MVININGFEIDLVQDLDFHFDLNDQQLDAIETISKFLDSDKQCCTLQGSAGVGKTTIVKIILHYVISNTSMMYLMCAPTHKAKAVLKALSGDSAETLHSILNLKPNMDITKFDARELDFMVNHEATKKKSVTIPYKGLIIVDEASMINNDLFNLVMSRAKENLCKVLFIGDIAQLQPVKQGEISRVFHKDDTKYYVSLNKVERQKGDNPLLDTLNILRDEPLYEFETKLHGDVGITTYKDARDFWSEIKRKVSRESIIVNPYMNRILTYTNVRVSSYNNMMRRILQYDKKEINVGELLMAYDGVTIKDKIVLINGSDYIVDYVKEESIIIPHFGTVPGYCLYLKDIASNDFLNKVVLYVIRNDLHDYVYIGLAQMMETLRTKAIYAKRMRQRWAGMYWRQFYEMNEAICSMRDLMYDGRVIKKKAISYGYAHTIHKS